MASVLARFLDARKINLKRRTLSLFAIKPDEPSTLLDNPIHGSQTQASAPSYLLGSEKGLKNTRLRFEIHSATGIAHGEHNVLARYEGRMVRAAASSNINVGCLEVKLPTLRHRIMGIDRQIHDHLFDLSGIDLDMSRSSAYAAVSCTSSPIRRRSIFSISARTLFKFKTLGSRTCRRLKARS